MRKTSLILTALLGIAFATAASADSPVRLTAKKVMPNTQIQDTLCNVTEITVLESTLRIKCHDYPGNIFAIHYEYPYYAMSFQGAEPQPDGRRNGRVALCTLTVGKLCHYVQ